MKTSILAAIAVTCFSCGALAASFPLNGAPPEVTIAFDALQAELNRRLEPGKGKPVRLDLPSATPPTAAEKAAFRAVFGTEQPLTIQRAGPAGKVTKYTFTLPAADYKLDDDQASWSALPVQVSVDDTGAISSGKWPKVEFHGLDHNLVFRDIALTARQERGSTLGYRLFQFGEVKYDNLTPAGSLNLKDFSFRETYAPPKNKPEQQHEISIKHATIASEIQVDDVHLAFRQRGMKLDDFEADKPGISSLLQMLAQPGANVELLDLSASFGGGKLRASGTASLPGATAADLLSEADMLKKLEVKLKAEMSTSTLRHIALLFARKNGKDKDQQAVEKEAQDIYSYALGKLLSDGYATLEKDKLMSSIEIKQGMLYIHDNPTPLPLEKLKEMMSEQSSQPTAPDEEDHSPPQAVLWRDRSLEQLQLFAANNQDKALRELCIRSVQSKDAEAAERWCAKAEMKVPDKIDDDLLEDPPAIKDNTLQLSLEGGYYNTSYYRFDPHKIRRLKLKLDNPQRHDKWAPFMKLCVQAETPSDAACLTFVQRGDKQITAYSQLAAADGQPRGAEHPLERKFKVGESIDVEIYVDDQQVHFWLGDDDGEGREEPVLFPAGLLSLTCSTADCSFKFE
ncbi:DUF945 family protein [Duganella sp. FT80W]|uniref:DUF945 family protein n=1 Tax=Duganella guangzhouensis TaxID=2666084 RepID=A0A6I2LBY1_9BURK|nr:DUF945 family protein [Duganella guangzhouensis]MRW94314.1 DUF945 family protein [Duganella guangzhouensis]